jgi:hypothetical protein
MTYKTQNRDRRQNSGAAFRRWKALASSWPLRCKSWLLSPFQMQTLVDAAAPLDRLRAMSNTERVSR